MGEYIQLAVRLIVIEGATGSGKTELASALAKKGYPMLRGAPSQRPDQNATLTPEAWQLLEGKDLNLEKCLELSIQDGSELMKRAIRIAELQYKEALKLAQEGKPVFLNRSTISLIAINQLVGTVAIENHDENLARWALKMAEFARQRLNLSGIEGLIFVEHPNVLTRLTLLEDYYIRSNIEDIGKNLKLPILILNPNELKIEDEIERVENFMSIRLNIPFN